MKFSVVRNGRTVCIGHCSFDVPDNAHMDNLVAHIVDRLTPRRYRDSGVTYNADVFYGIEPGDVINLESNCEYCSLQFHRQGEFTILDRRSRPATDTEGIYG